MRSNRIDSDASEETADELPPLSVAPTSRRRALSNPVWWIAGALVAAVVLVVIALVR